MRTALMKVSRLIAATAVVASFAVFTSGTASAAVWTAPGDPSELTASTTPDSSCSVSIQALAGETIVSLPLGEVRHVGGVCSFKNETEESDFKAAITAGNNLLMCTSSCTSYLMGGGKTGTGLYGMNWTPTVTDCPSVAQCIEYDFAFTRSSGTAGTRRFPNVGETVTWHVQSGATFHAPGGSYHHHFVPTFGWLTWNPLDPPRYYWTEAWSPGPPPVIECGTGDGTPVVSESTPRPDVPTSPLAVARTAVVAPGSYVKVTYPEPPADGQVYAKWADQPDNSLSWKILGADGTGQSLMLIRPATLVGAPQRNVVFKCIRPADPVPLFSYFVQAQNADGAGEWSVFVGSMLTSACDGLTINGLPRTGYVPGVDSVPVAISSSTAKAVGAARIGYSWANDGDVFASQAFVVGTPNTYTIPPTTYPDRYYEGLTIFCEDSVGRLTLRGELASNELDPLSTDLFPSNRDVDVCFTGAGIGLNPSSWVPAGGRMGSCVLTTLFVPSTLDVEALRRRIVGSAGVWAEPITAITSGVGVLTSTTGGCSYTVNLPVNDGLPLVFDSCTGGGKTGRELVYTVSSVSIALFGAMWMKRKAVSILTLNSAEAVRNENVVESMQAGRKK